jgi:hypothetical protein
VWPDESFQTIMTRDEDFESACVLEEWEGYQPLDSEKALTTGTLFQRLMYYLDEEFTEEEKQSINEFFIHCKSSGNKIPEGDNEILRNLYARGMDCKKAYDAITEMQAFRRDNFPWKVSPVVRSMLEQGIFYLQGRDRHLRPIVVIEAQKLISQKPLPEPEDVVSMCLIFFEFMTKYCLLPGTIENTIMIINCQNLSVWSMPYRMIKAVITTIQMCYKARSRAIFCLNAPTTFSAVWNVVKYVLDEITTAKV